MGCLPHNGAPVDWSSRNEVGRLPEGSAVEGVLINLLSMATSVIKLHAQDQRIQATTGRREWVHPLISVAVSLLDFASASTYI